MMPQLPKLSQRSGSLKVLLDLDLRDFATVATTFNNLNKKKGFRKNFSISCGNSGNKALSVMTLTHFNFLLRSSPPGRV